MPINAALLFGGCAGLLPVADDVNCWYPDGRSSTLKSDVAVASCWIAVATTRYSSGLNVDVSTSKCQVRVPFCACNGWLLSWPGAGVSSAGDIAIRLMWDSRKVRASASEENCGRSELPGTSAGRAGDKRLAAAGF